MGGCFLIFSWSRFRISLLLSIKNDVKCACRKLYSAVHTCISDDAWPYIQKGPRRIGGKKTTQRCTATSRQRVNTTTVCAHNKWQMRNDNIIHHAVVLLTIQPRTTRYRANTDNFAQNADGLSHNASLLLCLLSRCRAVIRVFTSLPQHVIALKIHRNLTACSFF